MCTRVAGKEVVRVQADLDKKVYDYFFVTFAHIPTVQGKLLLIFILQRLYEECQSRGIPAVWDEESGEVLRKILNELNFNSNGQQR